NDKPYLLSGVLDQGYYPDGLLTNPSDEALYNDIKSMKEMGFNLLRKHIKIEPLRWYYHCDKIGMIVWQDMINGSERKDIFFHGALAMLNIHINDKRHWLFGRRNKKGREQYMLELNEMISHLKNITCISTWVPFNEAWGQFDSLDVSKHIRDIDKTRLIDHASGWSDQGGTDFRSEHIYFKKVKFNEKYAKKRILALTEFGGYSLLVNENSFNPDKVFGYKKYQNQQDLEAGIKQLYENQIIPEVRKGLNVLIYTQLSDVEDEVNGFLTYDRKVAKVDVELIRQINKKLFDAFNSNQ
ncbi:MAG: glycoside hydrolase family 2 TIM barrel-domain containing protein, partial [Candidatus Izemoplasmatales bacterium]|nr:glycoside hydrolase family 2 TIM barrel-domain containing protein [Candidatus Izemoplasmatales bacterium]